MFMAAFAVVAFAMVFQSCERLFRQEVAQRRSDAMDGSTREKLRAVAQGISKIATGFLLGWAIRMIATGVIRDVATDMSIVSGLFFGAAFLVADFCGVNFYQGAIHKYR